MTDPDPKKVGAYVRLLRLGRNLTQQKLATLLDVAVSSVSNWESGEALPRKTWERLASYFGVSVDDLMTGGEMGGDVSEVQLRELFADEDLKRLTDRQRRGLALLLEDASIEQHVARVVVDLLTRRK